MRTLLFFVACGLFLFYYADRYGLAIGYAPFTPVFYWNYSGEARYSLNTSGLNAIKIVLDGRLNEGELQVNITRGGQPIANPVPYSGAFNNTLTYQADQGQYEIVFKLDKARGQIRYDWVGTKNGY